jgi:hypothetical protein
MKYLALALLLASACAYDTSPTCDDADECDPETGLPIRPQDRDRVRLGDGGDKPEDDGSTVDPQDGGVVESDADTQAPDGAMADADVPDGDAAVVDTDAQAQPDAACSSDCEPEQDAQVPPPVGMGVCEVCDDDPCAPGLTCVNLPNDSTHERRCFPACSNDDQSACGATFGADFMCWSDDGVCSPTDPNLSPYWYDQNCDLFLGR